MPPETGNASFDAMIDNEKEKRFLIYGSGVRNHSNSLKTWEGMPC
jgi:hypothetical protein